MNTIAAQVALLSETLAKCAVSNSLPGYDAWKTRTPWDDYEEPPEFHCEECDNTGFIDPGELCPACMEPVTLEDLEELAWEEAS